MPEDVNVWTLAAAPAEAATLNQVVPLLDKTLPLVPGATTCTDPVPLPNTTLLEVMVVKPVPPLGTVNAVVRVVMLPPVIDTLARLLVPLPMPLMPFTTVVKLLSNCDNGIADVAPANVFGIVTGSAIRTSLSIHIQAQECLT